MKQLYIWLRVIFSVQQYFRARKPLLIAVRFMEVNDYLPSRVRVLSSENPAKAEPDFVTTPFDTDLDFTEDEINLIDSLKDNNKSDELFQFLFIKQCNKLNEILPELFEKTNDYMQILKQRLRG